MAVANVSLGTLTFVKSAVLRVEDGSAMILGDNCDIRKPVDKLMARARRSPTARYLVDTKLFT